MPPLSLTVTMLADLDLVPWSVQAGSWEIPNTLVSVAVWFLLVAGNPGRRVI